MLRSTSIHSVSADCALSPRWQRVWWRLNVINNLLLPWSAWGMRVEGFAPDTSGSAWTAAFGDKSPSRVLCDMFWVSMDWNALCADLGALDLLDLGCGTGRYGERIQRWSGVTLRRYVGTDVARHDSWADLRQRYPHFEFREQSVGELGGVLDNRFTLIISQSAMEHFPRDRELMYTVARWQKASGRRIAHVHMLPSRTCLPLYQYHGVRQYTPRTCRLLIGPFIGWTEPTLYRLGGPACTALHGWWLEHVCGKSDAALREYESRLKAAIAVDAAHPSREATFYALTIRPRV